MNLMNHADIRKIIEKEIDISKDVRGGGIPIYKVKINYKSGISQENWYFKFNVTGGTYEWRIFANHNRPMLMNVENIESVYITDTFVIPKGMINEYELEITDD